jgi:NADH dehydrogenase [ubiquinone] 1 alpha subcomplex assembly factor 3
MRVSGCGLMLVGGEAFRWRPWVREGRKEGTVGEGAVREDAMTGRLKNQRGQWDVPDGAWGLLELVFPKPGMRPHNDTVRIDTD